MAERNQMETAGLRDYDIAVKFYNDFNDPDNDINIIGRVISNIEFNEWIFNLNIDNFNHGWQLDYEGDESRPWDSDELASAWNGYRSAVRTYLKNGVMSERYASLKYYTPYVVEANRRGVDLIIREYSEHVVTGARALASKRQKTIKNQSRDLSKGFDTLINVYNINGMEVQMQKKLMDSHNGVRFSLEVALDEMSKKMENDLLAILENNKKMTDNIEKLTSVHKTMLIEESKDEE